MILGTQDVLVALGHLVARELDEPVTAHLCVSQHRIRMQATVGILGHQELRSLSLSARCASDGRAKFVCVLEEFVRPLHDLLARKGDGPAQIDMFEGFLHSQMSDGRRRTTPQEKELHVHPFGLLAGEAHFQRPPGGACRDDVEDECRIARLAHEGPVHRQIHADRRLENRLDPVDELQQIGLVVGDRTGTVGHLLRVVDSEHQGVMPLAIDIGLDRDLLGHSGIPVSEL
ncbi:hypothetical protein D3C78_1100760 [compost metagenome]